MKRLLKWLQECWQGCTEGRYGLDRLSAMYLCISAALIACVLNMAPGNLRILTGIGAVILAVYGLYRCFSKDTQKQQQQLHTFEKELEEIDYKISLRTGIWKIKRSYRYVRCKNCGHRFRVPRTQKKQTITCPNCEKKISRRT